MLEASTRRLEPREKRRCLATEGIEGIEGGSLPESNNITHSTSPFNQPLQPSTLSTPLKTLSSRYLLAMFCPFASSVFGWS